MKLFQAPFCYKLKTCAHSLADYSQAWSGMMHIKWLMAE